MKIFTKELDWISPRAILAGLKLKRMVLLESVRGGEFSILVAKPRRVEKSWRGFKKIVRSLPKISSSLPFTGGAVGMLSYELAHEFEELPVAFPEKIPRIWIGLYDAGLVFNHKQKKLTAFGWSTIALSQAMEFRAAARNNVTQSSGKQKMMMSKITSNFTRRKYFSAITEIKKLISAGYTFQVNLSQRFSTKTKKADLIQIYERLSHVNPAPFAGFLDGDDFQIFSSSPELLFRVRGNNIELRPIAGTRPRGKSRELDYKLARELKNSAKENAEHIMLVDLARNDLGRICKFGSVQVSQLARIEKYARVQHLVSTLTGKLQLDIDMPEILRAVFPGGTITGCPKVETMKIISRLEKSARGAYTGSLGFVSSNGNSEFNILIRTLTLCDGELSFQAGGGIVADSDSLAEFNETLYKAAALFETILD